MAETTLSKNLNSLLEYFETPEDDDMRSYIGPEKLKRSSERGVNDILPSCGGQISDRTDRVRVETSDVKPMPKSEPIKPTSMVHIGESKNKDNEFSRLASNTEITKLVGQRYRAHERHHFNKINSTSFLSCSSPDGLYSEIALILWMESKYYSKVSYEKYRIVISLVFDGEDDLWSVSAKLVKRSSYLSKDEEEGQISNRLLYTHELRSDIKKMLLFLGISPRQAYRMFRDNFKENIIITRSEYGYVMSECESHAKLAKDFEKSSSASSSSSSSSPSSSSSSHSNWNYNEHSSGHYSRSSHQQQEKYKQMMEGYSEYDCYGGE